jgi:SAM-dependent methyltransferase
VLDLAAGTGKLTRSLVARGLDVVAVEPLPGMRDRLAHEVPGATALAGSAERIPLADGSVKAVCVAQAFHWFEAETALGEIARVLVPGGLLAILWNLWDVAAPGVAPIEEIVAPLEHGPIRHPTTASHPVGRWAGALEADPRFTRVALLVAEHADELDPDAMARRVATMSQVQAAPQELRKQAIARARDAVARMPGRSASFAYRAELELLRRA